MGTDVKPKPEGFSGCEAISFIDFIRENPCVSVANNAFYLFCFIGTQTTILLYSTFSFPKLIRNPSFSPVPFR